jgi:tetratricopeptide (TPR) repeat protein
VDKGEWTKAFAEFNQALEFDPEGAGSFNDLAWTMVSCPDAKLRDPVRALTVAKKAVERAPKNGMIRNTLAVAYYRTGDWKTAIHELEESMKLRNGGDSFDWFFLSMAYCRLGEKPVAKKWYDRAVQWHLDNKDNKQKLTQRSNLELDRFQKEAAELMGYSNQKDESQWGAP